MLFRLLWSRRWSLRAARAVILSTWHLLCENGHESCSERRAAACATVKPACTGCEVADALLLRLAR